MCIFKREKGLFFNVWLEFVVFGTRELVVRDVTISILVFVLEDFFSDFLGILCWLLVFTCLSTSLRLRWDMFLDVIRHLIKQHSCIHHTPQKPHNN